MKKNENSESFSDALRKMHDNWNSLFLETLNDSWRMSKDKRKKASRKINRLANEIVRDLLEWKLELARGENQKELQKLHRHVEEEYI